MRVCVCMRVVFQRLSEHIELISKASYAVVSAVMMSTKTERNTEKGKKQKERKNRIENKMNIPRRKERSFHPEDEIEHMHTHTHAHVHRLFSVLCFVFGSQLKYETRKTLNNLK